MSLGQQLKPKVVRNLATAFQDASPGDSAVGSSSLAEIDASISTVSTHVNQADTYRKTALQPPIENDGLPTNPVWEIARKETNAIYQNEVMGREEGKGI